MGMAALVDHAWMVLPLLVLGRRARRRNAWYRTVGTWMLGSPLLMIVALVAAGGLAALLGGVVVKTLRSGR